MSLTLVIGPMFSGKSTYIINKIREIKSKDTNTIFALTHESDTRYDKHAIVTHNQLKESCHTFKDLTTDILNNTDFINSNHVFIEEAHFFENLNNFVRYIIKFGKHVYVSGLSGNYKMEEFRNISSLVSFADNIIHLQSNCEVCHEPANFTDKKFKTNASYILQVGGNELYSSVCRKHHSLSA